jgi:hypothetical protein
MHDTTHTDRDGTDVTTDSRTATDRDALDSFPSRGPETTEVPIIRAEHAETGDLVRLPGDRLGVVTFLAVGPNSPAGLDVGTFGYGLLDNAPATGRIDGVASWASIDALAIGAYCGSRGAVDVSGVTWDYEVTAAAIGRLTADLTYAQIVDRFDEPTARAAFRDVLADRTADGEGV